MIGCDCKTCTSDDPRNQRYRSSVAIQVPGGQMLIDTPPELRLQLLRAKIPVVHAVLLTHYHADHLFGLDDVRVFPHRLGGPLPIYCNQETEQMVRRTFAYAFQDEDFRNTYTFVPQLEFARIFDGETFGVLGETVLPIPLDHAQFKVLGFRIGNVAYCTDVSYIPSTSMKMLTDLDVLVLDCLRIKPHPAHFTLQQALEVIAELQPRQAYLTHLSHDLEYHDIQAQLPDRVQLAYDNLRFTF